MAELSSSVAPALRVLPAGHRLLEQKPREAA